MRAQGLHGASIASGRRPLDRIAGNDAHRQAVDQDVSLHQSEGRGEVTLMRSHTSQLGWSAPRRSLRLMKISKRGVIAAERCTVSRCRMMDDAAADCSHRCARRRSATMRNLKPEELKHVYGGWSPTGSGCGSKGSKGSQHHRGSKGSRGSRGSKGSKGSAHRC